MFSKILFVLGMTIIGSAIACDLNGNWAGGCKDPQLVDMNDAMKKAILDVHNRHRNDIALGKVEHYDQAANMATMEWDDGLAKTAALNVHQCEMKHDDCRGTDQFPGAGQNLGMTMNTGTGGGQTEANPDQIAKMTEDWYNEQSRGGNYGWMDMINKFSGVGEGDKVVGHFTQYVWATANRIGCAVSTSTVNQNGQDWKATWLACNYGPTGNVGGAPVYEAGSATSKCSTGKNNDYPGLCSTNEKYE